MVSSDRYTTWNDKLPQPADVKSVLEKMEQLFHKTKAEELSGVELEEARAYLLRGLRAATGIPLEYFDDPKTAQCDLANTIHCTDILTPAISTSAYSLSWKGSIGSSDYDDGTLVYVAHLFPFIGGIRTCVQRQHGATHSYDYAFRYLLLTKDSGWEDRGWEIDEYGEFEHWYCD